MWSKRRHLSHPNAGSESRDNLPFIPLKSYIENYPGSPHYIDILR